MPYDRDGNWVDDQQDGVQPFELPRFDPGPSVELLSSGPSPSGPELAHLGEQSRQSRTDQLNAQPSGRSTPYNNNDALSPGTFNSYDEWEANFLQRNPGDRSRARAAYNSGQTGSGPDSMTGQTSNAVQSFGGASNPRARLNAPSDQFTDPYTNFYEQSLKSRSDYLQGNQELDRLMKIIADQVQELSGSPGYSPQEMALLNTQAFEPIEQLRQQSQRNVLERASRRGMLPSSGLVEDQAQNIDRQFDTMRTVANRDLAVNALNQRATDQARAVQLAQLGLNVPNTLGQQQLDVANLLYQLPRNAMMDSLAVVNASSPQSSLGSLLQLMQLQQGQANTNANNASEFWGQIGQYLPDLLDQMGL